MAAVGVKGLIVDAWYGTYISRNSLCSLFEVRVRRGRLQYRLHRCRSQK